MNKKVMKLASRGKRLGAYCIDAVVPFILLIISLSSVFKLIPNNSFNSLDPFDYGFGYDYGMNDYTNPIGAVAAILIVCILFVVYIGVQIYFYTKGKTIGKAIVGLQVISSDNGEVISIWRMILREWFAKKASRDAFLLGYIWILIDDKNRGWHDLIFNTYVVDVNESARINVENDNNSVLTEEVTANTEE